MELLASANGSENMWKSEGLGGWHAIGCAVEGMTRRGGKIGVQMRLHGLDRRYMVYTDEGVSATRTSVCVW